MRSAKSQEDLQGPEGIRQLGHRHYVGGLWEEIGKLQFDFLVSQGLQPNHYLLDIACGSLRGGVYFIPYLETSHYLGIDKEKDLIVAGIEKELGMELYERKKPQLLVSRIFEFDRFNNPPDYALAQSLFTHLPAPLIEMCFQKLYQVIHKDGVFYATFFEVQDEVANPSEPHDQLTFSYTWQQMKDLSGGNGWRAEYIGNWNHPRGQVMVRYCPQ